MMDTIEIKQIDYDTLKQSDYEYLVGLYKRHYERLGYHGFKSENLFGIIKHCHVFIAFKAGVPSGWLAMSPISGHLLDHTKLMSQQISMIAEAHGVAHAFYQYMIDFGKRNKCHIITMIGDKTRIKPANLEKMGFKLMETLYTLEV